jgi:hypothetical protein
VGSTTLLTPGGLEDCETVNFYKVFAEARQMKYTGLPKVEDSFYRPVAVSD